MEFQFSGFADFVSMSGHGVYVWIAYGVTFAALLALVLYPRLRRGQLQRESQRQRRIQQRRAQRQQNRTESA